MKMVSPIIITDDTSSLSCYISPERAASIMESIDVTDDIYRAYDAEGRLLEIQTLDEQGNISPSSHNMNDRFVRIVSKEEKPNYSEKLKSLITRDLKMNYNITIDKNLPLNELVNILFKLKSSNKKHLGVVSPIVVFDENYKINIFASLYKCMRYLKANEVHKKTYLGFDGFGSPLKFKVIFKQEFLQNHVKIENKMLKWLFFLILNIALPDELVDISVNLNSAPAAVTDFIKLLKSETEKNGWKSNDLATIINQYARVHRYEK